MQHLFDARGRGAEAATQRVLRAEALAHAIKPSERLSPDAALQMLDCSRKVRRPVGPADILEERRAAIVHKPVAAHEHATPFERG